MTPPALQCDRGVHGGAFARWRMNAPVGLSGDGRTGRPELSQVQNKAVTAAVRGTLPSQGE